MAPILLTEKVVAEITRGIAEGRWSPGDRLPLNGLAEKCGVSLTPVREAVSELVAIGILDRRRGVGVSVVRFAPDQLHDLYHVRAALEGLAARWLAEEASDTTLMNLARMASALDELHQDLLARADEGYNGPEAEQEWHKILERDHDFHRAMLAATGRVALIRTWESLHCVVLMAIAHNTVKNCPTLTTSARETFPHANVVAAIVRRDPDQAERAARTHLLHTWQEGTWSFPQTADEMAGVG